MEHLEHFTRNNVEVKKIITFSLNHSFCRADHRHVSLAHTQVQSQLFRVVRAKRGISLHRQFIPLHPQVFWPLHGIRQQLTALVRAKSPCDGCLEQEWSGRPAPLGSTCQQARYWQGISLQPFTYLFFFFFLVFRSCLLLGQKLVFAQGGPFCLTRPPREKSLPCWRLRELPGLHSPPQSLASP